MIWFDDHMDFVTEYQRIRDALGTDVACRPYFDRVLFVYERQLWVGHHVSGVPGEWESFEYYQDEPFRLGRVEVIEGGRCGAMNTMIAGTPGVDPGVWYSLCRRQGFATREHEWVMKLKRSAPFGYR